MPPLFEASVKVGRLGKLAYSSSFGAIAQLGERYNGIVEVGGSIPPSSTKLHDHIANRANHISRANHVSLLIHISCVSHVSRLSTLFKNSSVTALASGELAAFGGF